MDENSEGKFYQEKGTVIIEGKGQLSTLLENVNINIDNMEDLGEKKYRLQIKTKSNKV